MFAPRGNSTAKLIFLGSTPVGQHFSLKEDHWLQRQEIWLSYTLNIVQYQYRTFRTSQYSLRIRQNFQDPWPTDQISFVRKAVIENTWLDVSRNLGNLINLWHNNPRPSLYLSYSSHMII
jgi:hypothetical protein